ncbi:hypothetical protein FHY55_05815 [Oceanicola sp. D3]|uniref:hypothetical protein n=1 Tax=Oceanicola sp. D3 TaxID=2587163 RepID=UPI00111E0DF4|nr:hypothetical protein [Oceanicola sp. D3]QDC08781.1 hypothetical protein FHY55_05815 [Oceanicola sp. D3]
MHRALPLLACLVATPVAADDFVALHKMTRQLSKPAGAEAQSGAWAACLLGGGDEDGTKALFEVAGWNVFSDPEIGMAEISHPKSNIYVSLYMDGAICSVAHTAQSSGDAAVLLEDFLQAAGLYPMEAEVEGCAGWKIGRFRSVGLTSGGQDPVCVGTGSNDVRFYFPEGS